MDIGQASNERRGDGLEEGKEGSQGATQEDDIVPVVDRSGEGAFISVEVGENGIKDGGGGGGRGGPRGCFDVTIEFEKFGE